MEEAVFSLDHFEQLVYTRQHVNACIQLITALALLQRQHGDLDKNFVASGMTGLPPAEQRRRFCTRLASAASTLFADPQFELPPACLGLFLALHEWLGLVFSATAFGNADHVTRHLNPRGVADAQFLAGDRFIEKICVLYSTDSELELDFAALWAYDKGTGGQSRPRPAVAGVQRLGERASQTRGADRMAARQAATDR